MYIRYRDRIYIEVDIDTDCDCDTDTDPDNAVRAALSGSQNQASGSARGPMTLFWKYGLKLGMRVVFVGQARP
jgi:hypothetical protein